MPEEARDDGVLLTLPRALRSAFKDPLGPVETDAEFLLRDVDGPLVAVGDIVTYHFLQAGRRPDVALVDEYTKRDRVDDEIHEVVVDPDVTVSNPAGALTEALVVAIQDGLAADGPTTILVDGEEDLATLPAILAAPVGASVVYGQPDEGMVHVRVTEAIQADIRELVERMDGDHDQFWSLF
ncbi:GTP-dependent dephospho-CoA kinase family protein [Haloarchaeobius sp. TZWSO28]|uniref:GTP-dependent dephospho-CoA kinase family protein n=1 Tax=Haloarchaeobius sp. TZWSO28 TaxID=3446119 RepID=UPI003EBA91F9